MSASLGFAADYWAHLETPLTRLCLAEARCLAAGVTGWCDAFDTVWHRAIRSGALYLSDEQQDQLQDWIATQILRFEAEAQPEYHDWLARLHALLRSAP